MEKGKIELLTFSGCPLAAQARQALEEALKIVGIERYQEIDILDPQTPEQISGWGSPTILVDGKDLAGGERSDQAGCRIYSDGLLTARYIAKRIKDLRD